MKTFHSRFGAFVLGVATAIPLVGRAAPAPSKTGDPLIVRSHFIGSEQLLAAPGSEKLREVWNLKSSANFRNEVLNRFSIFPSTWLNLPAGVPTQTNLIRPLLDDLLSREFYLDASAGPEFVLAAHLSGERARLWETNLWKAVAGWKLGTPAGTTVDGFKGWEAKRTGAPSVIRFVRAGEWVVVSAGNGKGAREGELLASLKSAGRPAKPTGAWLDGDVNLARCSGWLPILSRLENLPVAHFSLSNRADFVRTYATLDFPKPHGWKPEPWRIPTNMICDPLIDFTAVRGVGPIFEDFKSLTDLGYKPLPTQIIGWGNRLLPFQLSYAAPSRDVRKQIKPLKPRIEELVMGKGAARFSGEIEWNTNMQEVVWKGLPVAVPHLGLLKSGSAEFVALGFFPPVLTTNQAPAEMYQSFVGRDELVAFDFELTEYRMPHWKQFYQLMEIATGRVLTPTNTPVERWFTDVAPKLGEAVTEVQSTSPTQMKFVRKSHIGLTAFELVTLGRWIECTNFPAFGIFPPQPVNRLPTKGGKPAK